MIDFTVSVTAVEERRLKEFIGALRKPCMVEMNHIGKNPPDFTLKLDRSDAKITITKINKNLCLVHGVWQR
jgi:hypothetical protein